MLNKGQQNAANYIESWFSSGSLNVVIEAEAGTGKSYLVDHSLQQLGEISPLLIAPTHEALYQLKEKTPHDYEFRTVASALGFRPNMSGKTISFRHSHMPKFWEDHDIVVVEEASMLDQDSVDLIVMQGKPTIWLGHSSQLPFVLPGRKNDDKCLCPAFNMGWETLHLTEQMRNTGDIYKYCKEAERQIYLDTLPAYPKDFNITGKRFKDIALRDKEAFIGNNLKIACWTNASVDYYNGLVRNAIYGEESIRTKFLTDDMIILTSPTSLLDFPLEAIHSSVSLLEDRYVDVEVLHTNTKGTVLSTCIVLVNLEKDLAIHCYKVKVTILEEIKILYIPVKESYLKKAEVYYERRAWKAPKNERNAAYRKRHRILSYFSRVKHFYAASVHRLQGSSVDRIIAIKPDILKNPCIIESKKAYYTAVSRARQELYISTGI